MKKNVFVLVMALVTMVMMGAMVSATAPVVIDDVIVNDVHLSDAMTNHLNVARGETMDVEVQVHTTGDVDDARFEASLNGYHYDRYERDLIDDVNYIDLAANRTRVYHFTLKAPVKITTEHYDLRLVISDKTGSPVEVLYPISFGALSDEDAIVIKDFTVSPGTVVEAGRPLTFMVRVKNYGDDTLDDLRVQVSVPVLGIADDEYLDSIDPEESETFEELLLRIPQCAKPGTYDLQAKVFFDEYEVTEETLSLTVLENGACEVATPAKKPEGKTVVTVPESQEVVMGTTGGVYPVMISNLGSTAKTYTLTASGVDAWGTVRFDPASVVVVQPESVKTVYMYVAAKDGAQPGAQVFKLSVESEDGNKQVALTANVNGAVADDDDYNALRHGLEIGLIVLVIILIILGLIIGVNKMRGSREDDESQTYY